MCADYRHASAHLVYEDQPQAQPLDTHMPSAHPSTAPAADPTQALYRKITRKLIPFLCFCYLAAYLDRINIGFAKLQMLGDLQFSETAFGLGRGCFLSAISCSRYPAICFWRKSAPGSG